MKGSRPLAVLAGLIPIASGCNPILGIENHSLAQGVDGAVKDTGGMVAAPGTACGFIMPNPAGSGPGLPNHASYTKKVVGTGTTVTDNVTGLTWDGEVKNTTFTRDQAVAFCKDNKEKGGGWRLPTRIELVSLVDFTIAAPGPTINVIFERTPPARFWTSSTAASATDIAWYVDFGDGSTHQEKDVTLGYSVRCVRGAPANCSPPRYEVQADGSVRDSATRLTWQRVPGSKQPWNVANTYCPTLGTGWRLPSVAELQSIVDDTQEEPSMDRDAFPDTPVSYFWTSSPQAGPQEPPGKAWYVTSIHGHADTDLIPTPFWVRCVR